MLTIQSILSRISCLTCTIIDLQVILSHGQRPLTCPLPPGVKQAPPVTSVLDDGTLEFKNGERAKPEVFLFCTGYNFTFPFLDKKVGVKVQEHLVWPLYKFLIPPAYPSLFIMGICRAICPFPHFHIQVSCKAKDILFKGICVTEVLLKFPLHLQIVSLRFSPVSVCPVSVGWFFPPAIPWRNGERYRAGHCCPSCPWNYHPPYP